MKTLEKIRDNLILQRLTQLKPIDWFEGSFPVQRNFILDPSKRKSALTTRRASKSYTAGLYAFKTMWENPGCNVLIAGLTRNSVKKIFWKDIIKKIAKKFNIYNPKHFNGTDLTYSMSNGSTLYLLGFDAKEEESEKALGQAYSLIVIDECASFRQDLKKIVESTLEPTLIDTDGTICLIGTPGNNNNCFFHDVTTKIEKRWSNHEWTTYDNPYIVDNWDKEITALLKEKPGIEDTPIFQQMYRKKWVIDDSLLIYKFNFAKNVYELLPPGQYVYLMGIDLGYDDSSSIIIAAYSEYDAHLYFVYAYQESKLIFSELAELIKKLGKQYGVEKYIIDGANKQGVEEMRRRFSIPFQASDKISKFDYIRLMNSDFMTGIIKVQPEDCKDYIKELKNLIKDKKSMIPKEHPACPNHLCDAGLYLWRHCYNYNAEERPEMPPSKTEQEIDRFWEREEERGLFKDEFI